LPVLPSLIQQPKSTTRPTWSFSERGRAARPSLKGMLVASACGDGGLDRIARPRGSHCQRWFLQTPRTSNLFTTRSLRAAKLRGSKPRSNQKSKHTSKHSNSRNPQLFTITWSFPSGTATTSQPSLGPVSRAGFAAETAKPQECQSSSFYTGTSRLEFAPSIASRVSAVISGKVRRAAPAIEASLSCAAEELQLGPLHRK